MNSPTETHSNLLELSGKQVLVLGLGESGLAMARYTADAGASVRVVDSRAEPPGLSSLSELTNVSFQRSEFADIALDGTDLIAWSPGISIELADGADFYLRAKEAGIEIIGELDLFFAALDDQNIAREARDQAPAQVIAITGTNGKTTVTELVAQLAAVAGVKVCAAGNIGPAMLSAWCDAVNADDMPDLWVLELSSFQLALARDINPTAAAILNVSQDHLDWHKDMATYVSAKRKIAGPDTVAIGLRSDDQTQSTHAKRRVTIGLDEPTRLGDFGLLHEAGMPWMVQATPSELPLPGKRVQPDSEPLLKRLMPADALRIRGSHNHLNAMAALGLCEIVGVDRARLLHGLRDYEGRAHRCELAGVLNDVDYYNDSKGTNVGATVAAIQGLGKRCLLIAGGIGKEQDFTPLIEPVRMNVDGVYLFGRDAKKIGQCLQSAGVSITYVDTMLEALQLAQENSGLGQAVLFSPACSSFDQFENYEHRGNCFKEAVNDLALNGPSEVLPC